MTNIALQYAPYLAVCAVLSLSYSLIVTKEPLPGRITVLSDQVLKD